MRRFILALFICILIMSIAIGCAGSEPAPQPSPSSPPQGPSQSSQPSTTSAADFYKNNVVNLICGYGAGGGVDFAARAFANYWPEVTNGGQMMVTNKPGAGGLLGANEVYAAKADGLTAGISISGEIFAAVLFGQSAVQFDVEKFNYIGTAYPEAYGFSLGRPQTYKSIEELQTVKGVTFGVMGEKAPPSLLSAVVIKFFNLPDAKIVPGFGGVADVGLAAARGEVSGYLIAESTLLDHAGKEFLQDAPLVYADFERGVLFPDVRAIPEIITLSQEDKVLLNAAKATGTSRMFYTSPDVSDEKVAFLRESFNKIMANDAFLEMMTERFPIPANPTTGQDLDKRIKNDILTISQDDIKALDELLMSSIR